MWTGTDLLVHVGALASGRYADGVLLAYDSDFDTWLTVGDSKGTAMRPVGTAGDRVLFEGDGRFYLSEPGWQPGGTPTATVCRAAAHHWHEGTADGLPATGDSTFATAEQFLASERDDLLARYNAISARIRVDAGRAWRRDGDEIVIVDEPIATIVLLLEDESACPDTPTFAMVPLSFEAARSS